MLANENGETDDLPPMPGTEAGDDQLLTLSFETRLCSSGRSAHRCRLPLSAVCILYLQDGVHRGMPTFTSPASYWPVSPETRAPIGPPVSAGLQ